MNKIVTLLLPLTLCLACSTTRKTNSPIPSWVESLPRNSLYYQGVGYAPKVKNSTLHYQQAYEEALRALSSEISVDIAASTLYITHENDQKVKDNFSSIINARVSTNLEGVVKADQYETRNGYWVLLQLRKSSYAEQQAQRKSRAVATATNHYKAALQAEQIGDYRNAIIQFSQTLDAIKSYFNEPINTVIDNQSVDLINAPYQHIYNILTNIKIETNTTALTCKCGKQYTLSQFNCRVLYGNKPINNFPVTAHFSANEQITSLQSNSKGELTHTFRIKSMNSSETLTLAVDKNSLLLQSATDFSIRQWLQKIPINTTSIRFNIQKPTVQIVANERNLSNNTHILRTTLEQLFKKHGFTVSAQNADYIIQINASTTAATRTQGIYSTQLNATIELRDANTQKTVDIINISTRGQQLSFEEAGVKAYDEASRQLTVRYWSNIHYQLLNAE